jgi:hypothetical protein
MNGSQQQFRMRVGTPEEMLWESPMMLSVVGMTPVKVALVTVLMLMGNIMNATVNLSPTTVLFLADTRTCMSRGALRICSISNTPASAALM